jgi:hypothetical protein
MPELDERQEVEELKQRVRELETSERRRREEEHERKKKERYSGFWGLLEEMGDQTCLD